MASNIDLNNPLVKMLTDGLDNGMKTFDPNKIKVAYGTYVPYRSQPWKQHEKLSKAKNSLRGYVGVDAVGAAGIIYEFKKGKWVEIFRHQRPDDELFSLYSLECDDCHTHIPADTKLHWDSTGKLELGLYCDQCIGKH